MEGYSLTVYNDICDMLSAKGYIVNRKPQEKQLLSKQEIIAIVTGYNITVESSVSYFADVECAIIWNEKTSDGLLESIPFMIKLIEGDTNISCRFKFVRSEVNLMGTLYQVVLKYMYTESVKIE